MKKIRAFVALDSDSINKNIKAIKKLYPYVYGFKIGYRAFYQKGSEKLIKLIQKNNSKLFLDLKLHDMSNNMVLATGRYQGTFKKNGKPLNVQMAHLWTLNNGKIASFQQFADTKGVADVIKK